jgi:hypothetical protein
LSIARPNACAEDRENVIQAAERLTAGTTSGGPLFGSEGDTMHLTGLIVAVALGATAQVPARSAPGSKALHAATASIAAREAENRKVVCRYIARTGAHLAAKACRAKPSAGAMSSGGIAEPS